jgi:dsDNA-binding SOS-regulon protein
MGRAQKALHRLPDAQQATYEATCQALKTRFDPESRQTRYQAEFQTRRKKAGEGWADFADDLKSLADKAYPTLQEEARERLSITAYLQQLSQPQVAFSVKQKRPDTLDSAVAATLEMESYLTLPSQGGTTSAIQSESESVCPVDTTDKVDKLTRMVEQLAIQVGRLQNEAEKTGSLTQTMRPPRRMSSVECWKCH